ncbi:VPLPA-CTERM sorting domain-containing protein [Candidatus Methylocalor cossyra]|uniref:VPLPA-CTERM sorting domain-containing protein n=1 Tax=Candidatus Methylocalor cossyra TaxID=3108543 RepID=A0ABP1CCF7_9GAMM
MWDGGNIGYGNAEVGDCVTNSCANLPPPNHARVGGANPMSGSVEDDRNMGWNHTSKWYTFQITQAGGYTISLDRVSTNTNNQPAFSVWTSGSVPYRNEGPSHKFNQVIAPISVSPDQLNGNGGHSDNFNDYMLVDDRGNNAGAPITGFVGYANSGPGYINAGGNTVLGALSFGSSVEGPLQSGTPGTPTALYTSIVTKGDYINPHAGVITAPYAGQGSSVNTSDPRLPNGSGGGHVDLALWLPQGWYVITGGGSCADFTCSPSGGAVTSDYILKILPNPNVSPPLPIPAAVWLFGSALVGVGLVGRRRAAAP